MCPSEIKNQICFRTTPEVLPGSALGNSCRQSFWGAIWDATNWTKVRIIESKGPSCCAITPAKDQKILGYFFKYKCLILSCKMCRQKRQCIFKDYTSVIIFLFTKQVKTSRIEQKSECISMIILQMHLGFWCLKRKVGYKGMELNRNIISYIGFYNSVRSWHRWNRIA